MKKNFPVAIKKPILLIRVGKRRHFIWINFSGKHFVVKVSSDKQRGIVCGQYEELHMVRCAVRITLIIDPSVDMNLLMPTSSCTIMPWTRLLTMKRGQISSFVGATHR